MSGRAFRSDGQPVMRIGSPDYFAKLHLRLQSRLPVWIVYRPTTREYFGKWVARMHVTLPAEKPTRFVMTHDTIAELRDMLPQGLTNIGRMTGDVPEIVEVWI